MTNNNEAPTTSQADKLIDAAYTFLATRPGFEYGNYGDASAYRADVRHATKQRHDAEAMLSLVRRYMGWGSALTYDDLVAALPSRLTYDATRNTFDYCAGQYYCTEYRGCVARWLASVLWNYWRDHCNATTREKIQACAKRAFRQRSVRGYFA